jgi:pyruvyl transferase EpsO
MPASLVLDLRQRIRKAADPLLDGIRRFALLEFPAHSNVGDSAIWSGEIRYLALRGQRPVFTGEINSYSRDRLAAVGPLDAILLHGGGNLGDVWPDYLRAKIRLLTDFRDVPVVQLPQTLHFQNPQSLDDLRRAVAAHKSFTLLARGEASLELARRHLDCEVRLCPDMAFWLDLARDMPRLDVLCLLRTDHEARDGDAQARRARASGVTVVDWLDEPPSATIGLERWLTTTTARYPRRLAFLNGGLTGLRNRAAALRVQRGCALLSMGKVVVTDRLHGHILCVLMGIPHVILDNNYGKLRQFYDSWTSGYPDVRFATSIEEALEFARGFAGHT